MKAKKSNKLYRKARPGWDSKVANRSELAKDDCAKKRKKRKPDKLKVAEILQFSLEGKFLREYSSMIEAGKDLGIDHEAIYRCLDGLQKTGGDFQWRYKIDPNFDEGIFDIPPVINWRTIRLQTVAQYTLEGKFVKEYSCVKEAAEICGISEISIMRSVRRLQQSAKKYQWRFKKDVSKDGKIMDIEPAKKPSGLAVCKFDMNGKFIREYPSMSEAARDECVSKAAISSRLQRKKCGEYQWRFKIEVEKDRKIIDIGQLKKTRSKNKFMSKYSYPVCQFGTNGTFIREYPSTLEAAKETNLSRHIIFSCALKKIKSSGGFQWRFKEEVVKKDGKIRDIEAVKSMSPLYFRAMCQFDPGGTFIREYPSIIEAAKERNIIKSGILSCAVKKIKSFGGFQWRFKEEVVKKKKDRKKIFIKPVRTAPLYYSRAVCQFKQDGKFVREYPSIYEASKKTDTTRSLIFLWASKKMKKRDGYLWRFKEDVVDKDGKISDIDTSKRRKKKKE